LQRHAHHHLPERHAHRFVEVGVGETPNAHRQSDGDASKQCHTLLDWQPEDSAHDVDQLVALNKIMPGASQCAAPRRA
jgi:hypothetical protein